MLDSGRKGWYSYFSTLIGRVLKRTNNRLQVQGQVRRVQLDERKRQILAAVVDTFIRTGEPVGSKAVLPMLDVSVSSATVRNDMAALERLGLLEQPHTSAGRVPSYSGYRYYIHHLMKPQPLTAKEKQQIDSLLSGFDPGGDLVVEQAVDLLAELTGYAIVGTRSLPHFSVITRVEVIPAGRRVYALLMITSDGSVKNKLCRLEFDLTEEQLRFFERFVRENVTGLQVSSMNPAMIQNMAVALGSYMMSLSPLLFGIYELSANMQKHHVSMKGEEKLLAQEGVDPGEVIALIRRKEDLSRLLVDAFDGIHVLFGQENSGFAIGNSSLIMSSYGKKGDVEGSLGLIGPIRINYRHIIPYMEYFSERMTRMLSDMNEDRKEQKTNGE